MLVQPNFSWFGKRTWKLLPYSLGLLNACLKKEGYQSWIYDPNFSNLSENEVRTELYKQKPDVIAITSYSTEYLRETRHLSKICKEELPQAITILGGIIPTVLPEKSIEDPNIDFCIIGEGEIRLPALINSLRNHGDPDPSLDGVIWKDHMVPRVNYIQNLDEIPFPDYDGLEVSQYHND